MDGNNLLVVCIPHGLNPAFTVPPDVYWELKGAVWEGSDPLLTADAKQGMLLRHSTSDLSSLLGKDFKHWFSTCWPHYLQLGSDLFNLSVPFGSITHFCFISAFSPI